LSSKNDCGAKRRAFDVLDYAVRNAPTARVSLERLARYNRLVHDVATFTIVERGRVTRIEHGFRGERRAQGRHPAEFTLAAIIVIGGQITGAALRARAVEFRHESPPETSEHVRLFGVEPRFNQFVNAMEVDRADLDRPVAEADPALFRVIDRHAQALLESRPPLPRTTTQDVRRVVVGALAHGDATLAYVAEKLRMSERSLQRKLSAERVTFDGLIEEMRRDLAQRYLADPKIAISEIAYLLGYSEASPFYRAFRRWTGQTPTEARRAIYRSR
jgi:AraC-like DNA-binding protein